MPIHTISQHIRTLFDFRTGDIAVANATIEDKRGVKHPIVVFTQTDPQELGSKSPRMTDTECYDFIVGMCFSQEKSLDVVIEALVKFKSDNFPSAGRDQTPPDK